MKVIPAKEFENYVGQETGVTEWLEITQERINQFADATNDHQFIHVDPEMAKATPWGSTIAHGFLTLSLLSYIQPKMVLCLMGCKWLLIMVLTKLDLWKLFQLIVKLEDGLFYQKSTIRKTVDGWLNLL